MSRSYATTRYVSSSGGGFTEIPVSGTVDGTNNIYTVLTVPDYLIIDGVWYKPLDNNGLTQWSELALTITSVIYPVDSIFGVKN